MARKRHGMYLSPTDDSQLVQELERCTVRGRKSDLLRNYALLGYQRAYAAWPSQPERAFNLAVSLEQLGQREIAFFFTREYLAGDSISAYLKQRSGGKVPYIANMRLSRADAVQLLASGQADAVSFGKAYIANPDLYERLLENAPFNELRLESMIGVQSAEGYTDYPSLQDKAGAGCAQH